MTTRFWTIPVCAALFAAAACSPPATTEAPAPAGDSAVPPALAAPETAAEAAPTELPGAPPTATVPPRPPAPRLARRPPAPPQPVVHDVTVASGTELPLELLTALSSETATVESEVLSLIHI